MALRVLGVPEVTVDLIKSFHVGMKAKIRLDSSLLKQIEVCNGF